ncbi:MAG TPA: hypothetical protein VJ781_07295, partial [Pyrinomonadaceae bacterium]|nr:hypothetical protein [Pyrinomonadaceae bacterium]
VRTNDHLMLMFFLFHQVEVFLQNGAGSPTGVIRCEVFTPLFRVFRMEIMQSIFTTDDKLGIAAEPVISTFWRRDGKGNPILADT